MKRILFCLTLITLLSCKKSGEHSCEDCRTGNTLCMDGILHYSGPVAADGLGWILQLKDQQQTFYVLQDPPEAFQVNDLAVHACLNKTDKKVCSWGGCFDQYAIATINKK